MRREARSGATECETPVRNASEHDSAGQVGETARNARSQVSQKSGTSGPHRARKRGAAGACQVVGGGMGNEV